jgi:hypothetical protein
MKNHETFLKIAASPSAKFKRQFKHQSTRFYNHRFNKLGKTSTQTQLATIKLNHELPHPSNHSKFIFPPLSTTNPY